MSLFQSQQAPTFSGTPADNYCAICELSWDKSPGRVDVRACDDRAVMRSRLVCQACADRYGGPRRTGYYAGFRIDETPFVKYRTQHLDGKGEDLDPRLDLCHHSPTGFEWGHGGSGPSQLSLAILVHLIGDDAVVDHHQSFKWLTVTTFPHGGWILSAMRAYLLFEMQRRKRARE